MQGREFKIHGFKGTFKITNVSPKGFLAEALSNTGAKVSLTKNRISGKWIASKGSRTLSRIKWL